MPTAALLATHADALLALATDEQLHTADAPQLFELVRHIFRSLRDPVKVYAHFDPVLSTYDAQLQSLVAILIDKLTVLLPEVESGDAARPVTTPEQSLFRRTQSIWRLCMRLSFAALSLPYCV